MKSDVRIASVFLYDLSFCLSLARVLFGSDESSNAVMCKATLPCLSLCRKAEGRD